MAGGSSKSESSSDTTTHDERVVADASEVVRVSGGKNSTSNVTINNVDAASINEVNSQLLDHFADRQADGLKVLSAAAVAGVTSAANGIGDLYRRSGEQVSGTLGELFDLSERSGANVTKSLDGLIAASERVSGRLIDSAQAQGDGVRALANTAIAAYQPPEAKSNDTVAKLGYAAAAVVAGLLIFRK